MSTGAVDDVDANSKQATRRRLTRDLVIRKVVAVGSAAACAGLLIAVLSRLAMGLLASLNPEDAGIRSDDEFVIGQLTLGGTAQLTASCIQLTLIGAALYLLVRPFLIGTGAVRVITSALGFGVTFAAVIIHPGGVDFTRLEPLWLGIALFVALPTVLVAVFAVLAEHWLRDESWFMTAASSRVTPLLALWILSGIGLVLLGPLFVIVMLVTDGGARDADQPPRGGIPVALKRSGQAVLVAIAGLGLIGLANDVSTVLG